MSLIHIICKRKGGRSFDIISGRRMRSIHLTTHCDALRRITTQQRKSQNLMCFNTLECSHEKPIRMSDMTFCFFCNNNINNRINNNINDINNNVYKGKPSTTLKTSTTASTNVKNHPSSSCNELKKHLEQQQEH